MMNVGVKRTALLAGIASSFCVAAMASAEDGKVLSQTATTVTETPHGDVVVALTGFADSVKSAGATQAIAESRRWFLKTHAGASANTDTWVSLKAGTLTASTTGSSLGDQSTPAAADARPAMPPAPGSEIRPELDRVSYSIHRNGWHRVTDYARGGAADAQDAIDHTGWHLLSDRVTRSDGARRPCPDDRADDPACADRN